MESTNQIEMVHKKNESCQQRKLNIETNKENRSQMGNLAGPNSFETYQQEHKKWFGDRRRTLPVIDWDQMRHKLEIRDLGFWHSQRQKLHKPVFSRKQHRNYWNISDQTVFLNTTTAAVPSTYNGPRRLILFFGSTNTPELKELRNNNFLKHYSPDKESFYYRPLLEEPPFGKADRSGKTAFGRLYQEPSRRHYRVYDNRDPLFENYDINKLINKTYDNDFRIKTHRKTQWHNRTFDPNYIFTHQNKIKYSNKNNIVIKKHRKYEFESLNLSKIVNVTVPVSSYPSLGPDFANYVKILGDHGVLSLRPKHVSFRDKHNNTMFINQENNDTFILQRSYKVPWDNKTNPFAYKTYCIARKRFYNKTLDIVFSHYIFHKFKCGNTTRDLGYGRMSNVINRWYNRTFVPKFRPDMFYTHNKGRAEKQLNYHKNELNTLHSMMSEGNFDPNRWAWLMTGVNKSKSNSLKISDDYERQSIEPELVSSSSEHKYTSIKQYKFKTTAFPLTKSYTTKPSKPSFFQSVKQKGFGFFKTLFSRPDSTKNEK